MAKYEPLARYLRRQKTAEVELSFRDIERIVGGLLPKASTDPKWWRAEDAPSAPPQQRAFAQAGYVPEPELKTERACARRRGALRRRTLGRTEIARRPEHDGTRVAKFRLNQGDRPPMVYPSVAIWGWPSAEGRLMCRICIQRTATANMAAREPAIGI